MAGVLNTLSRAYSALKSRVGTWAVRWIDPAQFAMNVQAGERTDVYALNAALYDNYAYDLYLPRCLASCGVTPAPPNARIIGYYNPFRQIVDVYQNVWPGVWGDGMEIAPTVDGKPVNPKLADPVRQIWRDSNLDTVKAVVQQWTANLGTVGLRVVLQSRPDEQARVRIQVDHPSRIFHVERDGQGNCLNVVLKYDLQVNRSTGRDALTDPQMEAAEVVEIIGKDEFSQTIDGEEQIADRRNPFGFCPYVLNVHKDNGGIFGDYAYKGIESVVHAINYRATQHDVALGQLMFAKWLIAAAGDKPESVDIGGDTAWYVKLSKDGPQPFAEAIVPKVDQKAALDFCSDKMRLIRLLNPEVALNDLQLYANISGETVAQVLKQVEACVLNRRPQYDHALRRAIQMALSIAMDSRMEGFNIGAGLGPGTGDSAYNQGLEAFDFAPRAALPQTPLQRQQLATADVADKAARFSVAKQAQGLGVDDEQVLREAGYDDETIAEIQDRRRAKDSIPVAEQ